MPDDAGVRRCGNWLEWPAAADEISVIRAMQVHPTDEYIYMSRALTPAQILASLTVAPADRWKESDRRARRQRVES